VAELYRAHQQDGRDSRSQILEYRRGIKSLLKSQAEDPNSFIPMEIDDADDIGWGMT